MLQSFQSNIEDCLKEFNFDKNSQKKILADIIGTVCNGIRELRLVDADDQDDCQGNVSLFQSS